MCSIMDIMHACDITPFKCQRKQNKDKEIKHKTCISEYLKPYFSAKSPPYLPI
jgi:hypothetical protein